MSVRDIIDKVYLDVEEKKDSWGMKNINRKIINKITERLAEEFQPEKIIIFGSHAWGTPGVDSDIDFFVLVLDSDLRPTLRAARGYRCLRGIGLPVEIIVCTKKEIERYKHIPSTLIKKILDKGKVVYG